MPNAGPQARTSTALSCGLGAAFAAAVLAGCSTAAGAADGPATDTATPPNSATTSPSLSTATPTRESSATPTHHQATHDSGTALAALAVLRVKGRAPMTAYDRDQFGQAWLDTNRNGCDTRNDILARDLTSRATRNCVIESGTLADPYTATRIAFFRGDGNLVDIDHVVALGNAWTTGALKWDIRKRAALANDPMNLLAVDAVANRQKGDGDAATWLPANKSYRCSYVARQVAVKQKYGLWVTASEKAAIGRVLAACPSRHLPPDSGAPVLSPVHVNVSSRAPSGSSTHAAGSGSVYYKNCDAARAAGAAPVRTGDPGYGRHLDRDGDGVACE